MFGWIAMLKHELSEFACIEMVYGLEMMSLV